MKSTGLPEKQPAGYGVLEGGRNSLLEFAQEATLTSVPTSAIGGQSNDSAKRTITCALATEFTRLKLQPLLWLEGQYPLCRTGASAKLTDSVSLRAGFHFAHSGK
jgi:hypothetical protein